MNDKRRKKDSDKSQQSKTVRFSDNVQVREIDAVEGANKKVNQSPKRPSKPVSEETLASRRESASASKQTHQILDSAVLEGAASYLESKAGNEKIGYKAADDIERVVSITATSSGKYLASVTQENTPAMLVRYGGGVMKHEFTEKEIKDFSQKYHKTQEPVPKKPPLLNQGRKLQRKDAQTQLNKENIAQAKEIERDKKPKRLKL